MKMTKSVSFILLLTSLPALVLAGENDKADSESQSCNAEYLVAHFEQSFGDSNTYAKHYAKEHVFHGEAHSNRNAHESAQENVQELVLVRKGQRVAHYNPKHQIANIWYLSKQNQQQLTRVFEQYQQGIEYQSGELKAPSQWHYVRSLVKQDLLTRMSLEQTSEQGCQQVKHYALETATHQYQLKWLPAVELPRELVVTNKHNGQTNRLQLTKLENDKVAAKQVAHQQFAKWDALPTTDYADVGDNENNPFLAKMINQGFSGISTSHHHSH
ncbi:hypothetical protein DXX94_12945 [Thalassotalea euphylliae]|uniref:DUF2167 domain-containing protein n=2 Tax=Thalassotalea euphylliae TaxID=1655234 RepID=A0A3E0U4S3_9GAMM|nr:hypothetical protein DXX94_12945 [Thalassotalea euphylliae]